MTQPTPPWIEKLLERNRQNPTPRYAPSGFEFQRAPMDTKPFMRDIQRIRELSQAGTKVLNQRLANQKQKELEAQQQKLLQAQQRAIDLNGIQPQYTGAARSDGSYLSPLNNYNLSSGFGPRRRPTAGASSNHQGVDLAAPSGTPIYATHDGVVNSAGWGSGYGWNVTLNANNGIQTFYGHQSKLNVKAGQRVKKGQVIGYVGSTGVSTGPHLHYGVKVNGRWVDPSGYY